MEEIGYAGLGGRVAVAVDLLTESLAEPVLGLSTDEAVLEVLSAADRLVSVTEAVRAVVIREVGRREAAERVAHCSTPEWIRRGLGHTIQRCRTLVKDAERQGEFKELVAAASRGDVQSEQASAIARVLENLPDDLPAEKVAEAERTMIGFAAEHTPDDLARLGWHLLEVIAPDRVDELLAEKLAREEAAARKNRGLSLKDDGHGTMHVKGKLPIADGEELAAVLKAHADSAWKRHVEEESDTGPKNTSVLMADALMTVVREHQAHRQAPAHGGDRPRVTVLLSLEALRHGLTQAALGSGATVSAGEARRLACDADVIPMVLNADGVPLDVGRAERLVTPQIRVGLVARDRGCVFPGCDREPAECEAHHVRPWWAGGPTSLSNLVLLCPRHHRTVEPGRGGTWDHDDPHRWRIRLGADGIPEVIPPVGYDPQRKVLRHARFTIGRFR